jgi:hypothetical protein
MRVDDIPGGASGRYWLNRSRPAANVVKATGMVGTNGLPAASTMLPTSRFVRSGLPSLKMITPEAFAASALRIFTPKLQPPRWIRAIRMKQHLALTTKEAVARLQGRWVADVAAYDQVHAEILHMSAMLSDGIIRQFSTRF